MQEVVKLINFLVANKVILLNLAGLAAVYAVIELWAWLAYGPKDTTGNGITIGRPKAFDNRSLQLRIERLSNSLANLKVVNQNVTESLSTIQKQSTVTTSRSITLEAKASPAKTGDDATQKSKEGDKGGALSESAAADDAGKSESKSAVALSASDVLSDQLNLASQILNLETLYERSLTDRLIEKETRLQTVLGFQVSITPPRGCENSVAVVEVAVRMPGKDDPVSLVAMIPQEKTYNAQTVSTSAQSISGSAVFNVVDLGFTRKGESRQLFIHKDSDTIAFERDPRSQPTVFDNDSTATVFGWEFRPVLGRSSVSPGTRQMLAMIAVPTAEFEKEGEVTLQIQTRSYWRNFNQRTQTSGGKWSLLPWSVDQSMRVDSALQVLKIPNTARIQGALEPVVKSITWVNSGADRATVIVTGKNFFSGTKVLIGGVAYREEDGSLTLKSSQALEFETTIASLVKGDCVLSGRFGASFKFTRTTDSPITALTITKAVIESSSFTQEVYMLIDLKGLNSKGKEVDLQVKDIQQLPEPILFVGAEVIPMPYDYFDIKSEDADGEQDETSEAEAENKDGQDPPRSGQTELTAEAAKDKLSPPSDVARKAAVGKEAVSAVGEKAASHVDKQAAVEEKAADAVAEKAAAGESDPGKDDETDSEQSATEKSYVQVGAWIPKSLASSPSVSFRVPFCGFEYQTSYPLSYAEPTVTWMGSDGDDCIFRIASPTGFIKPLKVELDTIYEEGSQELEKASAIDYRFRVPIRTVKKYKSIILRPGRGDPYVVPLCIEDKAPAQSRIITMGKPPQIKKGSVGALEWLGSGLENVTSATLMTRLAPLPSTSPFVRTPVDFSTYDEGKKIEVYFTEKSTSAAGKAFVEFKFAGGETKIAPLFITNGDA